MHTRTKTLADNSLWEDTSVLPLLLYLSTQCGFFVHGRYACNDAGGDTRRHRRSTTRLLPRRFICSALVTKFTRPRSLGSLKGIAVGPCVVSPTSLRRRRRAAPDPCSCVLPCESRGKRRAKAKSQQAYATHGLRSTTTKPASCIMHQCASTCGLLLTNCWFGGIQHIHFVDAIEPCNEAVSVACEAKVCDSSLRKQGACIGKASPECAQGELLFNVRARPQFRGNGDARAYVVIHKCNSVARGKVSQEQGRLLHRQVKVRLDKARFKGEDAGCQLVVHCLQVGEQHKDIGLHLHEIEAKPASAGMHGRKPQCHVAQRPRFDVVHNHSGLYEGHARVEHCTV
eukprot:Opistho-2@36073